jgi:hypothetical protein
MSIEVDDVVEQVKAFETADQVDGNPYADKRQDAVELYVESAMLMMAERKRRGRRDGDADYIAAMDSARKVIAIYDGLAADWASKQQI